MCEAHAYILENNIEMLLLESVDSVEIINDEIRLINIFGEQDIFKGKFVLYDNTTRKIIFIKGADSYGSF